MAMAVPAAAEGHPLHQIHICQSMHMSFFPTSGLPKTHRKWVWAFIDAIAELVDVVVSNHSVGTGAGVMYC